MRLAAYPKASPALYHHNTLALTSYLRWLRWWRLPDGIRTRNQSVHAILITRDEALPLSYWQMEQITGLEPVRPGLKPDTLYQLRHICICMAEWSAPISLHADYPTMSRSVGLHAMIFSIPTGGSHRTLYRSKFANLWSRTRPFQMH